MLHVGSTQEPDRQQDLLVFLDEAIPVAGSIRAHRKEIFGGDQSGVETPRTFHEIRFTVEGLVKNASHCLGIGSISKNNQGSFSGEVPVLIALGEVLMHLGDNTYFEIANCAGDRILDFHEGLKRLLQMELVGMVAGVGKDTHFHIVLRTLGLVWVSTALYVPKVPRHGTFLGAECIVESTVERNSDHQPERGLAAPRADLVRKDSKLRELGREVGDTSNRGDCCRIGIFPGQQKEALNFASECRIPLLERSQGSVIGGSGLGLYRQSQPNAEDVVSSLDDCIELKPGGGRCGGGRSQSSALLQNGLGFGCFACEWGFGCRCHRPASGRIWRGSSGASGRGSGGTGG